jgi:DNA-binding MarR family transcriptional regulator
MPLPADAAETALLRTVASSCLCQKARTAARVLTRFYDQFFTESGIEPTQFNLLVAIRLAGPVPMARLASLVGVERTTLTRNIDLLRRDGLVEMSVGADARRRLLTITEAGRCALTAALQCWTKAQKSATALIGADDIARLLSALQLSSKLQPHLGKHHEH